MCVCVDEGASEAVALSPECLHVNVNGDDSTYTHRMVGLRLISHLHLLILQQKTARLGLT